MKAVPMSRCKRTGPNGAGSREMGLMTEDDMGGNREQEEGGWDASGIWGSWPGVWEDAIGQANSMAGSPGRHLCYRGHQTGQGHQERDKLRFCVSRRERGQIGFRGVYGREPGENSEKCLSHPSGPC